MRFAPDVVDNEKVVEKVDLLALKKEAIKHLSPGETVSKALIRLGNAMKAQRAAGRGKGRAKGQGGKAQVQSEAEKAKEKQEAEELASKQKEKEAQGEYTDARRFELLTEAASKLMDEGWTNIYQYTLEQLRKLIKQEEGKGHHAKTSVGQHEGGDNSSTVNEETTTTTSTTTTSQGTQWEYKTNLEEEQVFGGFAAEAMAEWKSKGYIDGAFVRKVGEEGWTSIDEVSFL